MLLIEKLLCTCNTFEDQKAFSQEFKKKDACALKSEFRSLKYIRYLEFDNVNIQHHNKNDSEFLQFRIIAILIIIRIVCIHNNYIVFKLKPM